MEYIVKPYKENGTNKWGVYDNHTDTRCVDIYNGLILLVDNKEDADVICYILNKEDMGLKDINADFKIGDIVNIKNHEFTMGVIKEIVRDNHYWVKLVDEYGNYVNKAYFLHKNEISHKF